MAQAKLILNKHVIAELEALSKSGAINELWRSLKAHRGVRDPKRLLADVLKREGHASTVIGYGVAVPHAMTTAVSGLLVCFGRSTKGIPTRWHGRATKIHFFLFIAFSATQVNNYLRALAHLTRRLHDASIRRKLLKAKTSRELLDLLTPSR